MNNLPPPLSSPPWTMRTKRVIVAALVIIIGLFTPRLSEILPIIGVAMVLAYLLTPLVNTIENRIASLGPFRGRSHRNSAVLLTYVIIITGFIVVLLVVVPVLVGQLEEFGRRIPALIRSVERSLETTLSQPLTFNGEPIMLNGEPFVPLDRLREATGVQHLTEILQLQDVNLVGATQTFIGSLTGPAFNFVGGALTAVINLIFLMSMMFFLMRDGGTFIEKALNLTPNLYRGDLRRLFFELGQVWNAYLRGQLTLALFMGTAAFIAASLLGLPNPLILGLISGLLEFIPSLGPGLAIFPAALLALTSQSNTLPFLEGAPFALIVIIVWALLQNLEAIILVPRIMGGSLNLHPFVVIVGIIGGASLAGLLGIILAAPVIASLRVFAQYVYGKLMDRDPFPIRVRRTRPSPRQIWPIGQAWIIRASDQVRGWVETRRKQDV